MGVRKIRETYVIGTQRTGRIEGVYITAVAHEGLTITVNGKPGKLAILAEDGTVVAEGADVSREAAAVAINMYRSFLIGQGRIRVISDALGTKAP
jgi:NaMN:DMB phosphoribosyltransferase